MCMCGKKSLLWVMCCCVIAAAGCNWDSSNYDEFVKNDTIVPCPPGNVIKLNVSDSHYNSDSSVYYISMNRLDCYYDGAVLKETGKNISDCVDNNYQCKNSDETASDVDCSGCSVWLDEYRFCAGYRDVEHRAIFNTGEKRIDFVSSNQKGKNQITAFNNMSKGLCPVDYQRCTYISSERAFGCINTCPDDLVECDGMCVDPNSNNHFCGAKPGCGVNGAGARGEDCSETGKVCVDGKCSQICPNGQVKCKMREGRLDDTDSAEDTCVPISDNRVCGAKGLCNLTPTGTPEEIELQKQESSVGVACDIDNDMTCMLDDNNAYTCQKYCTSGRIKCTKDEDGTKVEICVSPDSDTEYCGAKGNCTDDGVGNSSGKKCNTAAGEYCKQIGVGEFDCGCANDQIVCSNVVGENETEAKCTDPRIDPRHCGARGLCNSPDSDNENYQGAVCLGNEICKLDETDNTYRCMISCPDNTVICGNVCVDPKTSLDYCGAKGHCDNEDTESADYSGDKCEGVEQCVFDGEQDRYVCGVKCDNGLVKCSSQSVDEDGNLMFDENNDPVYVDICINPNINTQFCGAKHGCSNYQVCSGGQNCVNGECKCEDGYAFCGNKCVNLNNDPKNCNSCGHTCAEYETCDKGQCKIINCNGYVVNNPEAQIEMCVQDGINVCADLHPQAEGINYANCGACGYKCSEHPKTNAIMTGCIKGECDYQCNGADGYIKCPVAITEGIVQYECVNKYRDVDNCGGCQFDYNEATNELVNNSDGKDHKCDSNSFCNSNDLEDIHCTATGCASGVCNNKGTCQNVVKACGGKCLDCTKDIHADADGAECFLVDAGNPESEGYCKFTQCLTGYHPVEIKYSSDDGEEKSYVPPRYECAMNDAEHCGVAPDDFNADSVINCKDGRTVGYDTFVCNSEVKCEWICSTGYHKAGVENECVVDDVHSCNGVVCTEKTHWKNGACTNGLCDATECYIGYHTESNLVGTTEVKQCVVDTVDNCSGANCSVAVAGWQGGYCVLGNCNANSCKQGYHLDSMTITINKDNVDPTDYGTLAGENSVVVSTCVRNANESCGSDNLNCTTIYAGDRSAVCDEASGRCKLVKCGNNEHIGYKKYTEGSAEANQFAHYAKTGDHYTLNADGEYYRYCERNTDSVCGQPDSDMPMNCNNLKCKNNRCDCGMQPHLCRNKGDKGLYCADRCWDNEQIY